VETHWLQPNPPTRVGGSNINEHAGSSQPSEPQETNSLQPNPPTRVGGSNINEHADPAQTTQPIFNSFSPDTFAAANKSENYHAIAHYNNKYHDIPSTISGQE